MRSQKNKSATTDTRLTQSNILNTSMPSSLYRNQSPMQSSNNLGIVENIKKCESRELEYLRLNNMQLHEKNSRLVAKVRELEKNNKDVLAINADYVRIVNQFYQNTNLRVPKEKSHKSVDKGSRNIEKGQKVSDNGTKRVLEELEKDHRNLVKHCQAM